MRAVVRTDHVEAQLDATHLLQHLGDQQRVAQRLAHLLAGGGDPRVVQPVRRERVAGGARLRLLVLVVREPQVDAAAVDVERGAEVLAGHRRALDVPAGATRTPGGRPGRCLRLGLLLPPLPEREVAGVALAARVGVGRGLHVVDALAGQLAVGRPRQHVEVDVAGPVVRGVRVATPDQLADQLDHLRDVTGGGRFVGRRQHVERGVRPVELAAHDVGEVVPGPALLGGLQQDLVVDVGDVADEVDLVAAGDQPSPQHVEVHRGAHVTDVGLRLHGEAAHVDARPTLLEGDEVAHLPRGGVVEAESHRPILRARRPADCHGYVTGDAYCDSMRHPRLVAVVIGLVLLGVPIGVGMHDRGVLTSDANLAAGTTAQHTYTSWKGAAGFGAGTHEGTTVADGELVMGTPIGTKTLGGRSWQTSRWTSAWATPAHAFTQLVPSWNAATPDRHPDPGAAPREGRRPARSRPSTRSPPGPCATASSSAPRTAPRPTTSSTSTSTPSAPTPATRCGRGRCRSSCCGSRAGPARG